MEQPRNVSWSEIQTWCACRMKWRWAYEVNIVPKRFKWAPSVGSCGHVAIAAFLQGKDWAQAVEHWLEKEITRKALFDEEIDEYRKAADLILGIVPRYIESYRDDFRPVLVEHKFEIPVRGTKMKLIGYWDAIVMDRDGHLWLLEHKFPKQFRSDNDLDLDGQIGVYQYAARRLGYPIVGTIYNQLLNRLPAIPEINKDGSVSRKAAIYTDWKTYSDFVVSQGLNPDDYREMEDKLTGRYAFFQRNYIYRPLIETRLFARDMERRIWDMRKSKKHVYRSEFFIICGWCPYRELCLESLKGGDIDHIIENDFEQKTSREEKQNDYEIDEIPTTES